LILICFSIKGTATDGQPVYLRNIWPSRQEIMVSH